MNGSIDEDVFLLKGLETSKVMTNTEKKGFRLIMERVDNINLLDSGLYPLRVQDQSWIDQLSKKAPLDFLGPNPTVSQIPILGWQYAAITGNQKISSLEPVELYRKEIEDFIARINELSELGSSILNKIIRDHKSGDTYRLPLTTEVEFLRYSRPIRVFHSPIESKWFSLSSQGKPILGIYKGIYEAYGDERNGVPVIRAMSSRGGLRSEIQRLHIIDEATSLNELTKTGFRLVRMRP